MHPNTMTVSNGDLLASDLQEHEEEGLLLLFETSVGILMKESLYALAWIMLIIGELFVDFDWRRERGSHHPCLGGQRRLKIVEFLIDEDFHGFVHNVYAHL